MSGTSVPWNALVVDEAFHAPLQAELARLSDDIEGELDVCVVTELVDTSSTTARQVHARLQGLHQQAGLRDPTLRLRPRGTGGATLAVSEPELVFPPISSYAVTIPHVAERFVTLANTGSAPVSLYYLQEQWASWGGLGAVLEPRFMIDPADVFTFPVTLAPGQSRQLRVYFTADVPPCAGDYR
ncbi:hypothetical protein [Sorangium sp. So ce1151]|uniref:hypothetical protein n=1 Tax=Sorangium sp. So ce1151 TaxID=3133332 RepID=UPI003F60CBA7